MFNCPKCGAPSEDEDNFCGNCQTSLADAPRKKPKPLNAATNIPACSCGANASRIDTEGFCLECGRKQSSDPHNHAELIHSPDFAAVTDRGKKHSQNEDAILVAHFSSCDGPVYLLAISDGVSTSYQPDKASGLALEKLRNAVFDSLRINHANLEIALETGFNAAQAAVAALPNPSKKPAPAATLVAALVLNNHAVVAWIGDSRAYLLGSGSRQLTRDDSWINSVVDSGDMTFEQASKERYAHAIVACLCKTDDDEEFTPHFLPIDLTAEQSLLLCSDGLWNYADTIDEIEKLISTQPAGSDAVSIAREFVAYANNAGGKDNISVGLIRSKI